MTNTPERTPFKWVRLARPLPAIVLLASATVLLGPAAMVERLGLTELLARHRTSLGVCILVSAATLTTQVLPFAFVLLRVWLSKRWHVRKGRKRLHELTRSEKNLLNQYISRETRTLVLDVSSGATSSLLLAGVIRRAAELDDKALGLAFNIEPWAWTYLRQHRQLLETAEAASPRLRSGGPGATPTSTIGSGVA